MGERRGLNPRMVESQSTALPLGYARHLSIIYIYYTEKFYKKLEFYKMITNKHLLSSFVYILSIYFCI